MWLFEGHWSWCYVRCCRHSFPWKSGSQVNLHRSTQMLDKVNFEYVNHAMNIYRAYDIFQLLRNNFKSPLFRELLNFLARPAAELDHSGFLGCNDSGALHTWSKPTESTNQKRHAKCIWWWLQLLSFTSWRMTKPLTRSGWSSYRMPFKMLRHPIRLRGQLKRRRTKRMSYWKFSWTQRRIQPVGAKDLAGKYTSWTIAKAIRTTRPTAPPRTSLLSVGL